MLREIILSVDDTIYQTLKPLVEEQTIGPLLYEFVKSRIKERSIPDISTLRGTLHQIDTSDLRDEDERYL